MESLRKNWYEVYQNKGALWARRENTNDPHVEVSTECHSDGFFNYKKVISDPFLMKQVSFDILEILSEKGCNLNEIDGLLGILDDDAILARSISTHFKQTFSTALTVTKSSFDRKIFLSDEEMLVVKKSNMLLCTNVIAKGENLKAISYLMRDEGVNLLPYVATLMNRSGYKEIAGLEIISPLNFPFETWDSYCCDLCRDGNKVISGKKEWKKLVSDFEGPPQKSLEKK